MISRLKQHASMHPSPLLTLMRHPAKLHRKSATSMPIALFVSSVQTPVTKVPARTGQRRFVNMH